MDQDQIARNPPDGRFPALTTGQASQLMNDARPPPTPPPPPPQMHLQMSPQAIDAELMRLPPQLLAMLRGQLGLDHDGPPLRLEDKAHLLYAARHRMSMHTPANWRAPNAFQGRSGPQQQPPPGHPQFMQQHPQHMQQQPPPGQQGPPPMQPPPQRPKRNSTSPPELQ
jgi:hypothetical protein